MVVMSGIIDFDPVSVFPVHLKSNTDDYDAEVRVIQHNYIPRLDQLLR